MSAGRITRVTLEQAREMEDLTDWERVDALTDEEITAAVESDPDAFFPDDDWWRRAVVVPAGVKKEKLSLHLDEDVIAWFRQQGSDYQHLVNHTLRRYMQDEERRRREAAAAE